MMGTTFDLGLSALGGAGAPGDGHMWMYNNQGPYGYGGYDLNSNQAFGDMAFRLYGDVTPIPEPEIYAMMGLGLGLLGWVGRRRKQQAA